MTSRADDLLAGPRGRRMCLSLVLELVGEGWSQLSWPDGAVGRFDVEDLRRSLATAVSALDVAAVSASENPGTLLPPW